MKAKQLTMFGIMGIMFLIAIAQDVDADFACLSNRDCAADEGCDLRTEQCYVLECIEDADCHSANLCTRGRCVTNVEADRDRDGVPDGVSGDVRRRVDNCPEIKNTTQSDLDKDGIGDVCDEEWDSIVIGGDDLKRQHNNLFPGFYPPIERLIIGDAQIPFIEMNESNTYLGIQFPYRALVRGRHENRSGNTSVGAYAYTSGEGTFNVVVGKEAGKSLKGNYNVAIGSAALESGDRSRTVEHNTVVGFEALKLNTDGNGNTALGSEAMRHNRTGENNTAIGYKALHKTRRGENNTAVGFSALLKSQDGHSNVAIGRGALSEIGGYQNTAIGYRAGSRNRNGRNNVYIGAEAGNVTDAKTYSESDQLVIANGKGPERELIRGDFAAHIVNIHGDLHADGNLTQNSDGRLKTDIQPVEQALASILLLEGRTYRWNEDTLLANRRDIGLIAQDVEKVFPELVAEDRQGYKGIAYSKLTAVLIEAVKEQQQQFTAELTAQQEQITALEQENVRLKAALDGQMQELLARVAMLEGAPLVAN